MEPLKHECGIALVRLRKPLPYYQHKYGTWLYGLNKLYLLMEKQHNRGQEGAGIAVNKTQTMPGDEYLFRLRAEGSNAITEVFDQIHRTLSMYPTEKLNNANFIDEHISLAGETLMGHLRYSTTGRSGLTFVHPMIRRSNWRAKSLAICGNFNLTNVEAIFNNITGNGQSPRNTSDTYILLDQIGHALDREVERLYQIGKQEKGLDGMDVTHFIEEYINLANVLKKCSPLWDGGYVMCGLTGSGESYIFRDPKGIRPAYYYIDEEIIVVASERPVIQTVMNLTYDKIQELDRGMALLINKSGNYRFEQILEKKENCSCSFERIYFSRGSDYDIYRERKKLGKKLVPSILKAIEGDIDNTVFSFIPNTAEVAYHGMIEGLNNYLDEIKFKAIKLIAQEGRDISSEPGLEEIINRKVRMEKVAIKDIKLRTFIAEGNTRNDLATHVYDITYGSLKRGQDKLVVIDDSIVRGTTLKQSILRILDRLGPTTLVIASSAPQIRYPDYYGIDMRDMDEFIAFRAAIELHKEHGTDYIIYKQYKKALRLREYPKTDDVENVVKTIYDPFTAEEISDKIVDLVRPYDMQAKVKIIFQSIEGLEEAIPNHPGKWYFNGNYPTPGGKHLLNEAFIRYFETKYNKK